MGWTQADLARACEIDRSAICRAEQGKGVSTHLAAQLAKHLGYPVEAWLGEGKWLKS